jgi:hypothetical protein
MTGFSRHKRLVKKLDRGTRGSGDPDAEITARPSALDSGRVEPRGHGPSYDPVEPWRATGYTADGAPSELDFERPMRARLRRTGF